MNAVAVFLFPDQFCFPGPDLESWDWTDRFPSFFFFCFTSKTELVYFQHSVGVLVLIVLLPLNGLKVALKHPLALIQDYCEKQNLVQKQGYKN